VRLDGDDEALSPGDRKLLVQEFGASLVFPLRSKGETVGALLLGPKVTGTVFTSDDVALLSSLAGQMSVSLQNGLLLRERVAVARMEEELNLARRIQSTFLPSEFPAMPRVEVYGVNTPSREVGGDYFDLVPSENGAFYLAIADVSGKGVPAALLTSMLQASLRTQAETQGSVSSIVTNMNALIAHSTTVEQFATFFLCRIDQNDLRMSFSNAGHNYPIVYRRTGDRLLLERGGIVLGMMDSASFEEASVDLEPGDRVVFYTDGVNEAMNRTGEDYGEERLMELVQELPAELSSKEMTERIIGDLYEFLDGEEPQDDVTVMILRVLEASPAKLSTDEEAVGVDIA
jgi:sigma-B regulation protein RsbU (phosphoserine phosphatase)